ncbi:MAG: LacI family DNA-binding transcriptional regulator [Actinoallomurus sp.]
MAERRPTIADVAAHAGVSLGAVSFALNGRPGVGEQTRKRILEVARELGWQPSHRARSLSTSRAFSLGLVLARSPELFGADPFFPSFIGGVETVLSPRGQSLVLQVVPDLEAETEGYRRLAGEARVDGVFLSDLRHDDTRLGLLDEVGLPAVTLNRPDVASPFPAVCLDDRPGIAEAAAHLLQLGHTRIAHVAGTAEFLHGAGRRTALVETLAAAGLAPGPVIESDFTAAGGAAATRELLDLADPPTAIVYANDLMAVAGMAVAQKRGFAVPERLSVTGFDDTELAAYTHPALTTVRTNAFVWGQAAARVLLDLVAGDPAEDTELAPGELVVRGSTGPPPQ